MNTVGETWFVIRKLLLRKLRSAKKRTISVRHVDNGSRNNVSTSTAESFKSSAHIFTDLLVNPVEPPSTYKINYVVFKYRKLPRIPLVSVSLVVTWEKLFTLPAELEAILQP